MRSLLLWAHRLLALLVFLGLPTFLITATIWWAFTSPAFYRYGFERFDISEATGIPPEELRTVAREFTTYFSSPEELLHIQATIGGVPRPLFNDREMVHMRDVKGMVQGVRWARNIALALLLAYVGTGFATTRDRFPALLRRRLLVAALATAAGVVLAGALLAVAFPVLFRLFHVISFRNPFWLLDPATDYLVQLFPGPFWFEATLVIALAILAEALLLAALAWGWRRFSIAANAAAPTRLP